MGTVFSPAALPPTRLAPPAGAEATTGRRIASLDIIRGAVMVLMALDHVRVYAGVPPGGPTFGVFFTRWVTHFCAPAFVFLAGTAAFLHREKLGSQGALARYLVTRGAWLILLDVTLLRLAWTFNLDYASYTPTNVIWTIGWCMILLAAISRLPVAVVGAIGVAIIGLHNLTDLFAPGLGRSLAGSGIGWLWQILYFGGPFRIGGDGPQVVVLFSIVPWVGVIAAGYAFGAVMRADPERRGRLCLRIGLGAVALFVALRALDVYGDPRHWQSASDGAPPAILRFLGTTKYPASLLFLLMTLGPTIALVPLLDRARGRLARWLSVFGRVPFFYYVLHIPLIHLVAVSISLVRTPAQTWWLFTNHPIMPPPVPDDYRWSLTLLYVVTAAVVVALYLPCRWFAGVKARRKDPWLSYL